MSKPIELSYWINERYLMKMRKDGREQGAKWTWKHGYSDDPHMGLARYCNVHREDDKVTKWLAKNWRPQHHEVWEIVLARMVNFIPSLQQVLIGWQQHKDVDPVYQAAEDLRVERSLGKKIWTAAYTISTAGNAMDKIDYVMGVVEAAKVFARDDHRHFYSLAMFHRELMKVDGLGSFLAAQVAADLKNTVGHPLQDAPDWHTWAAPGPGSLKGLSEYFGEAVTPKYFSSKIKQCYEETMPLVNPEVPPIHMQDWQNCLCEFSKYMRVTKGGHARNSYRAG